MLPINKKNGPCDPISSNCVIWQGPDLPCVDICEGDSISAVVAGLCNQLVILQDCCGSGAGSFNINNINQTTLDGGPATTVTELIQLIINNINNSGNGSGSGSGIWDCKETFRCTLGVPECLTSISNLSNPDSLEDILTYLMNEHCSDTQLRTGLANSIQEANTQLAEIKRKPTGDPNPVLTSAYVDKGSATLYPVATLLNKVEVAYGHTADNVGSDSDVLNALAKQPVNPLPLAEPINKRQGFVPSIPNNPTSIAESLDAAWRLIVDLRNAVETLQASSGSSGILLRMTSINTFFASGSTCGLAATNAQTAGNCVDLWNSTGIRFDMSTRAYSQPIAEAAYELTNGVWYALCPGTTYRAQYLGGPGGAQVAPFWTVESEACS